MLRFNGVNFLNIAASFLTAITVDYCVISQLSLIKIVFLFGKMNSHGTSFALSSRSGRFARFTSQLYGFTASRFYVVSLQPHTTQGAVVLVHIGEYIHFHIQHGHTHMCERRTVKLPSDPESCYPWFYMYMVVGVAIMSDKGETARSLTCRHATVIPPPPLLWQ